MKIILASILLVVTVSFSSYAQKAPIKYGDVSADDLKMAVYSKDSAAEAVILADYGVSSFIYNQSEGFQISFERIRRVKMLKAGGLDWANLTIQLYHKNDNSEKISGLKAATYNLENGKVVTTKVKTEGFIKEKFDENIDNLKITWPNVKVGSIIEVSYGILSDFLFNFQDWEFQSTIPVVWSEYRAAIPEYFFYEKYMQGYVPLNINEATSTSNSITLMSRNETDRHSGQSQTHSDKVDYLENRFRWVAKDVPAFKPEPLMTNYRDYISKINFEISYTSFPNNPVKRYMGTWLDISKSYWTDIGKEITGNNFLKKQAEETTTGRVNVEEKVAAIYDYVKSNFLWDETNRKYLSNTIRKVFDEKKGSSSEINLLMASLLEKTGIQVFPVLLSTRDHGFVREAMPVSTQFNYVICLVKLGEKAILLDATDKFLVMGMLPENCLNGNGLMVSEEGFEWINLQPTVKTRTVVNADLSLTQDATLKGRLKLDRSGYHGISSRKSYLTKGETAYIKEFTKAHSWELSKSEFQNTKELSQPFKELHELIVNEHITSAGGTYYFNPFIYDREGSNPFKQEKRIYPVDFGTPYDEMNIIKFTVPDGFLIEELPKSKVIALPNSAKYTFNCSQMGNIINITSNLSISRSLFSQEEYPNLREFYNQVVAKQEEQIVLKKK